MDGQNVGTGQEEHEAAGHNGLRRTAVQRNGEGRVECDRSTEPAFVGIRALPCKLGECERRGMFSSDAS